ncbi:hypothetical protein V2J09_007459 [Rumex salicifolius]
MNVNYIYRGCVAHIITAVIGSGVLALAWAVSQLGWVAVPVVMVLFALITYTSALLADCYRHGDPVAGKRNYTYTDAVKSSLDNVIFPSLNNHSHSLVCELNAINMANCFHEKGKKSPSPSSSNTYIIIFGVVQIFLSQIPNFDQLKWLSVVAAVMSITYSSIGLGLGISQVVVYPSELSLTTLICLVGSLEGAIVTFMFDRDMTAWAIYSQLYIL